VSVQTSKTYGIFLKAVFCEDVAEGEECFVNYGYTDKWTKLKNFDMSCKVAVSGDGVVPIALTDLTGTSSSTSQLQVPTDGQLARNNTSYTHAPCFSPLKTLSDLDPFFTGTGEADATE
jgi:hypothetical protein